MGGPAGRGRSLTARRRVDLDEDDVRVRPSRRGSRPRTRTRPAHEEAAEGWVLAVDRGRYTCLVGDTEVTAMRARELGRRGVVLGDRVSLVGGGGGPDDLARIVRIAPRATELRRSADDAPGDRPGAPAGGGGRGGSEPQERVIVANADQLVVVAALADPPPRTGLIDRCLVAAYVGGLHPLLCLTKADLGDPGPVRAAYADLSLDIVTVRRDRPLTELAQRLAGRVSVLVGHSGVGKSTLVNGLVPAAARATGRVSGIGRGRHTSSSAVALRLPDGWIIDTPGIRAFGLAHVGPDDLLAAFPDLAAGAEECPVNCAHSEAADGCALDAWVAAGHATPGRLASFHRLLPAP